MTNAPVNGAAPRATLDCGICLPDLAMASRDSAFVEITPEVLLKAYACGIFPMAESADDPALYWIEPEQRGVIPLDAFHVPARLARTVRAERFTRRDQPRFRRGDRRLRRAAARANEHLDQPAHPQSLSRSCYDIGHCHTVEVYDGDALVGGLYGVSLGRTFFGESMFHRARDASKVALVHLVARLKAGGFALLDTQFVTDHLKTFGAIEVPRKQYHKLLRGRAHRRSGLRGAARPVDAGAAGAGARAGESMS